MKKYKLIKEYPGSPKLGTELTPKVDKENSNTNNFYWEGSWFNPNDFSEYWKEVIEKDYEILISRVVPQEILSVKRLSDGEVFSVGDLIKTPYTKCTPIVRFQNPEGNEYFIEISSGFTRLLLLEKVKQPIFLTHDGKDIFEGDEVYWVKKDSFAYDSFYAMPGMKFFSDLNAYFLTREQAEDYIKRNKVLFTTEDGVSIKKGDTYYFVNTDFSIQTMKALRGAGQYSERKYFSTVEQAHEYVIQNVKALSIEDFWEITCMSTSNFNKSTYMRDLVKKTLGIK